MLQTVKLNVLIPLKYEESDFIKSQEKTVEISRKEAQICQERGAYNSYEWFHYCFRNKPIESNFQMQNSPLLTDRNYEMSRIELNSVVRASVGLHKNENTVYTLQNTGMLFTLGKIRVLFTKSIIAFLNIEIMTSDLTEAETRIFINTFSRVTSRLPIFTYQQKLSRDNTEIRKLSLKELVEKVQSLQSYISLSVYEDKIVPYLQISLIGTCENEDKLPFFDAVQALSPRPSSKDIDKTRLYVGREDYISRFAGDRSSCIYGDLKLCDSENQEFISNIGNGLVKSATENYTTVYAFLISLHLLSKGVYQKEYHNYLLNAPIRLSDEDNIREFYEQCLWNSGWNLKERIELLRSDITQEQIEQLKHESSVQRTLLNEQRSVLKTVSEGVQQIQEGVGFLVDFVKNELQTFLATEKERFNRYADRESDEAIGTFIDHSAMYIDEKITMTGDEIIKNEREGLSMLFGSKWQQLMASSQTSLVSAGTLLKKCADINTPNFDYSGICICATSALEAELKRIFFNGLIDYMIKKYGNPEKEKPDEIYRNWPDALLTVPSFQYERNPNSRVTIVDLFTMGKLPYLFGETGKLSGDNKIRSYQLQQSEMMKMRMSEYLQTIVETQYKDISYEKFYGSGVIDGRVTSQAGSFVWKCEKIRNDYRNKAAHVNVMTGNEATSCYQSVITKPGTYEYNAEVTGVLLDLFFSVDVSRVNQTGSGTNKSQLPNNNSKRGLFIEGQTVDLTNLELTSKGVLRGTIIDSNVGASLSRKYLADNCINARQYLGKTIKVRLVRWDENGQKFNAELSGKIARTVRI